MSRDNPNAGASRLRCLAAAGLLLAGLAVPGLAEEDYPLPAWSTSLVSRAMCGGSKIHLVATGTVAVAYERAYVELMRTNVLENVQAAYLRELPPGAKTNLVIMPLETRGHYLFYWNNEHAAVQDVWRSTDTNSFFEGGYIVTGTRFFGAFETVMNIHVQRTDAGQAGFRADVLVYPHNGLIRFIFNNVLSVESYFRKTMADMSVQITRICTNLCLSNDVPATATAPAK